MFRKGEGMTVTLAAPSALPPLPHPFLSSLGSRLVSFWLLSLTVTIRSLACLIPDVRCTPSVTALGGELGIYIGL